MFTKLLISLLVLTSINGWVLNVSHNHVTPTLTSNITIKCQSKSNDQITQQIKYVFLIQILKLKNQKLQTVASMTLQDVLVKTNLTYATATGIIGTTTNSYIQIHYNVADGQTHGHYVCRVGGLDQHFKSISIKTEPVVITEDKVTYTDFFKILGTFDQHEKDNKSEWEIIKYMFVQMYDDLQKVTAETNTTKAALSNINILTNDQTNNMNDLKMYISTAITNITTHQETINNDQSKKIDDLTMYITNLTTHQETIINDQSKKIDDLKMYVTQISTTQQEIIHKNIYNNITSQSLSWPAGKYSIPEPDTGCPNTTNSTWAPSSYRISTAPYNNNDTHSSNLNLAGSVFKKINNKNYFTMKLCSMTSDGQCPVWPVGSYCVQVYSHFHNDDRDCPNGLRHGYTRYGRFNDNSKDEVVNLQGYYGRFNSYTYIYYCCRDDGSPTNPIILPRQQPFYLYRYGGRCQEVVGMEVSNQWIHTDTGKWGKKDKYYYGYGKIWQNGDKYNPDGSVTNGVTTHICYYTPRD